jgi:hypothetical protein
VTGTQLPLAVTWWAPLAIIGGALAGAAVGLALLALAGGDRTRPPGGAPARVAYRETDKTNYVAWNPAAVITILALVGLVVGLAVGLAV